MLHIFSTWASRLNVHLATAPTFTFWILSSRFFLRSSLQFLPIVLKQIHILRGNILLKKERKHCLSCLNPGWSLMLEVHMQMSWSLRTSGPVLHQMINRINIYLIIVIFLNMPQERSRPRCSSSSDPERKSQNKKRGKDKSTVSICTTNLFYYYFMLVKKGGN